MRFINLEIQNFGSIENISLNLDRQGLVLITGNNKDSVKADSNGAGKSLLLEAFCWCLWGKTIRGLKGDEVVNTKVGKDCKVTITLEDAGESYVIVRTRKMSGADKPNDIRVYKSHTLLDDVDFTRHSNTETQELINSIVGMDFVLFCVLMPGAGKRASEMTDKEIKTILESLLRTELLGDAWKIVNQNLKTCQQDIQAVQMRWSTLERTIKELEETLDQYCTKSDAFQAQKESDITELELKLLKVEQERNDCMSKIFSTEDLEEKLQKIKDNLDHWEHLKAEVLAASSKSIKTLQDQKYTLLTEYNKVVGKQEAVKARINGITIISTSHTTCPTCEHDLTPEHIDSVVNILQQEVIDYEVDIKTYEDKIAGLDAHIAEINSVLSIKINSYNNSITLCKEDIKRFERKINENNLLNQRLDLCNRQISDLEEQINKLVESKDPFTELIDGVKVKAFELTSKYAREYKELLRLEHEEQLLMYWLTGFSPKGIRSFMLEHVTPLLNAAAEKYAKLLTDGEMSVTFNTQHTQKSGKVVEKFNIQVDHAYGGDSYAASSAGEKSRANLVIAFALGDLAALRANKTISFRFLDEPFENVDESGTAAIVSLLNDQKERFETVFVITHQDHFKQLFPKKLTVVKKDGFTNLEVVDG